MIGAFPDLYPDELLVSGWARYEAWVQYAQRKDLLEELFGYYKPSVDYLFPSCLGAFVAVLPPGHSAASIEALITHHTLLPYYGAFLPAEQQQALRQKMSGSEGVNIQAPLGLSQYRHQMPQTLRYCPVCAAHDRATLGETYWHRQHQVAGVAVCPAHAVWLEATEAPMWLIPDRNTFPLAETLVVAVPARPLDLDNVMERYLFHLAQAAAWLFQHPATALEDFQLQTRCRVQLVHLGLASYGKRFKQREILPTFQEKLTPQLLAYLACDGSNLHEHTRWLSRLLQGGEKCPNFVLYALLLILFVADDIPAFLTLPTDFAPFGNGPWPCLNPACPHDGVRCLETCEVYYHPDGLPRGTFTCPTCAYSYRRVGPDTSLDDHYRRHKVISHGPLWDAKLQEVWVDPTMNVQRMSSALGSTWDYMRRRGTELGLPFPPAGVRPTPLTRNPLPLKNTQHIVDPTPFRSRWLALREEHPDWGVNDIRQQDNKLYSWLGDNDREWLEQHKPPRRYKKRTDVRVNWQQRDEDLAAEVSAGYERLMARQTALFQVTKHAILNEIRRRGYYRQNRYRLPQTEARLEQLAETTERFAIRRIWHHAHQFKDADIVPSRRVLAEKAHVVGPPHRQNLQVQEAVDEAIIWLREG